MKIHRRWFTLLILSAGCVAVTTQAAEAEVLPVAVLDLDAADARLKERGSQIALLVTSHLSTLDNVVTVERQELSKLLEEQELGTSGMVSPSTAARIGHLTGARVLVTGRLFTVGKETTAALKVMSTETGRVYGAVESFAADVAPNAPAEKLGAKIAELLQTKRDTLVASVTTDEDRIAALQRRAAGAKLPALSISIPEQHFGPQAIDPAAATEIGLFLGKAGFPLVTRDAANPADYLIEGEAFSEAGIRRGYLVSCKARVEIKVIAKASGKILLTDRQQSWSVDAAEHIAAKQALQKAGAELATRIGAVLLPENKTR